MKKELIGVLICVLVVVVIGYAAEQSVDGGDDQDALMGVLGHMDSAARALKLGDNSGGISGLQSAYDSYMEALHPKVENIDDELDNQIIQTFDSLTSTLTVEDKDNVRALRSDIMLAGDAIGVGVPFPHQYGVFFVLGMAALLSFMITLVTKGVVDWPKVKALQEETKAWQNQLREAQRKRDMKIVYKLQQDQKRIMGIQSQVMKARMKPMIFYFIPLMVFWFWLSHLLGSWVVAWLPFILPLPFFGTWTSCGFLSWYFLTYFGFSTLWQKLIIGE
jgi:uncharacterized membrane protein (DUF106 family)